MRRNPADSTNRSLAAFEKLQHIRLVYVTEIFSTHQRITPVHNFGVTVPNSLYSIAYF